MPTRQGGILPKNSMICLRRSCRLTTTWPALCTPCTWNTFLARSTPMVLTCMWTTPSGDSLFNDHPLAHSMPGAGVVHHIIFVDLGTPKKALSHQTSGHAAVAEGPTS